MSATDVRISLMRLNTFGDEVFGDQKVKSPQQPEAVLLKVVKPTVLKITQWT